ncbi:hypothetical protein V5O48_009720 [Marasmius crinis-equi]|uniref:Uncharacterized protein n=1 Tax=Marasmius crinis-equi TaxID=585013 RepID=A0ABR3FAA5_9AGAR
MPTTKPFPDFGTNDLIPRRRKRILGGFLLSTSEAAKWGSQISWEKYHQNCKDDGSDDQTARLLIKKAILDHVNWPEVISVVTANANGMVTEDNRVARNPIMIATQERLGRFVNTCTKDCEEVTDEKLIEELDLKPGPTEEAVLKKIEALGIEPIGYRTFFY